jgi:ABC-type transport system involved in multi-copper enzyme maturation permease subunit
MTEDILTASPSMKRSRLPELPVMSREMRSTMRGRRLVIRLAIAGLLPVALCVGLLALMHANGAFDDPSQADIIAQMPTIGRAVFLAMVGAEFLLILFVAPGLTASSVTSEQEAQTLESLFLTPLSSLNLALGKLLTAVSVIALLLLCAFPIIGVAGLYGGVAPVDLGWTQGILFSTLLFVTCFGLLCSTLAKRTTQAILLAYFIPLALFLGSFIVMPIVMSGGYGYGDEDKPYLTVLRVIAAMLASGLASIVMHGCAPWIRGRFVRNLRQRWWMLALVWVLAAAAFLAPLEWGIRVMDQDFSNYGVFMITGNPLLALGIYAMSMYMSLDNAGMPAFAQHALLPVTVGILVGCAALFFWAAVQRLNILRRPE